MATYPGKHHDTRLSGRASETSITVRPLTLEQDNACCQRTDVIKK